MRGTKELAEYITSYWSISVSGITNLFSRPRGRTEWEGKRSPEIVPDTWEYNGGILLRRGAVGPRFESCSVFVTGAEPTLDSNRQNPNLFRPESVRSRPASGVPALSSPLRSAALRAASPTLCDRSLPAGLSECWPVLRRTVESSIRASAVRACRRRLQSSLCAARAARSSGGRCGRWPDLPCSHRAGSRPCRCARRCNSESLAALLRAFRQG